MERNATLLIAAAFTMIGFVLGRVTAPHPPHPAGGFLFETSGTAAGCASMGEDVQVIMTTLEDGDFDGDTVLAIPGGQVMVVERDGEMEVEVEMEEAGENVWIEKESDGAEVIVRKRVIVTTDEQR